MIENDHLRLEEAEQDQELADEVARPGHRERGEGDDQEDRREDRRPHRDPAHVADVLGAAGARREQPDDEEERGDDDAVVDHLQDRALGHCGESAKIPIVMKPSCATDE